MDLPARCHTCRMPPRRVNPKRVKQPASRRPLKIEGKAFWCPPKITCPQALASGGHIHCEQPLLLKTHMWQAACLKTAVLNTAHLQLSLALSHASIAHWRRPILTLLLFVRKSVFPLLAHISEWLLHMGMKGEGMKGRIIFFKAKATEHHAHTAHSCHIWLWHALQPSLCAKPVQKTIAGPSVRWRSPGGSTRRLY